MEFGHLCDAPDLAFGESRWFTRGWTLQEFSASKELESYDNERTLIGSKGNLFDELYGTTRVDHTALRGANLRLFSVARMS